jgi:pyridoxine kinase
MKVDDAKSALAAARALGRRETVVTSVPFGADIGTVVASNEGAFAVTTPRLSDVPHGTGDLFAALYFAARLRGAGSREALAVSATAVDRVIRASVAAKTDELVLIAEQNELLPGGSLLAAFPITA